MPLPVDPERPVEPQDPLAPADSASTELPPWDGFASADSPFAPAQYESPIEQPLPDPSADAFAQPGEPQPTAPFLSAVPPPVPEDAAFGDDPALPPFAGEAAPARGDTAPFLTPAFAPAPAQEWAASADGFAEPMDEFAGFETSVPPDYQPAVPSGYADRQVAAPPAPPEDFDAEAAWAGGESEDFPPGFETPSEAALDPAATAGWRSQAAPEAAPLEVPTPVPPPAPFEDEAEAELAAFLAATQAEAALRHPPPPPPEEDEEPVQGEPSAWPAAEAPREALPEGASASARAGSSPVEAVDSEAAAAAPADDFAGGWSDASAGEASAAPGGAAGDAEPRATGAGFADSADVAAATEQFARPADLAAAARELVTPDDFAAAADGSATPAADAAGADEVAAPADFAAAADEFANSGDLAATDFPGPADVAAATEDFPRPADVAAATEEFARPADIAAAEALAGPADAASAAEDFPGPADVAAATEECARPADVAAATEEFAKPAGVAAAEESVQPGDVAATAGFRKPDDYPGEQTCAAPAAADALPGDAPRPFGEADAATDNAAAPQSDAEAAAEFVGANASEAVAASVPFASAAADDAALAPASREEAAAEPQLDARVAALVREGAAHRLRATLVEAQGRALLPPDITPAVQVQVERVARLVGEMRAWAAELRPVLEEAAGTPLQRELAVLESAVLNKADDLDELARVLRGLPEESAAAPAVEAAPATRRPARRRLLALVAALAILSLAVHGYRLLSKPPAETPATLAGIEAVTLSPAITVLRVAPDFETKVDRAAVLEFLHARGVHVAHLVDAQGRPVGTVDVPAGRVLVFAPQRGAGEGQPFTATPVGEAPNEAAPPAPAPAVAAQPAEAAAPQPAPALEALPLGDDAPPAADPTARVPPAH